MISYFKKGIINIKLDDEAKSITEILNSSTESRIGKFTDEVRFGKYNTFITGQQFDVSSEEEFEQAKQSALGSI